MWGIDLNRESELSLRRQIYLSLKGQIMNGQLKANENLPSTREFAKGLGVSRNTVCEAYEMLIAEGFAVSSQGAPTRVSEGLYLKKNTDFAPPHKDAKAQKFQVDFRTGCPELRLFPRFLWQQMIHKACEKVTPEQMGYSDAQGLPELRKEIVAWLFRIRGLIVDSDDVFITAGATHALHLIGELLCRDRKEIIMEDPCHTGMLKTLMNKDCDIIPIPVDEKGIKTDLLPDDKNVSAIYVTPSHQFPLGGILPASRRAALIRFATEKEAYIIEDDYDSEFRYCGEPIAPLYSMEPQRVIYVGTFSKSVFPALRIGYVILPKQLQKQWIRIRTFADVQNPIFEQAALTMFLQTRKLDRHVQKMRRIYGGRRSVLLDSLIEAFGKKCRPYGDDAGLHLAVELPGQIFDAGFHKKAAEKGINITPVEYHCIQKGNHKSKLLLGYGHLETDEIRNGIRLLHELIKENDRIDSK